MSVYELSLMSRLTHEFVEHNESVGGHDVQQIEGDFPVDEAVLEVLPKGSKIISAESHAKSAWTVTGRMMVDLPDRTTIEFFIKCANEEHGRMMMLGEFTSISRIHDLLPGLVPRPHGWGKYKNATPEVYFFLSDFIEMDVSAPPDPAIFTARIAELHHKGTSPNGMFGFDVTTFDGRILHTVTWEKSWSIFFAKLLQGVLNLDIETNGPWPPMEAAAKQVVNAVIPRLLGVLQADGRTIKPSLIHGDLCEGNIGTRTSNGDIVIYDAGSYYAHNEMELGIWRCQRRQHLRSKVYFDNYLRNFPPAEPTEEWDDRDMLYSLKYNLNYSAGHPGDVARENAYNDMCYLCEKYAPIERNGAYSEQSEHKESSSPPSETG